MFRNINRVFVFIATAVFFHCCIIHQQVDAVIIQIFRDIFSSIFGVFRSNSNIDLRQVMLIVDNNMNERRAVKLHLVIVYEPALFSALTRMKSTEYFRTVKQITRDNPEQLEIFKWTLEARTSVGPWTDINYNTNPLTPAGGIIFASYNTLGEHRIVIPQTAQKLQIQLNRNTFYINRPSDNRANSSPQTKFDPMVTKPANRRRGRG